MANLGKVVYLNEEQKKELFKNDTITVGGVTITYSENDMYVTPAQIEYKHNFSTTEKNIGTWINGKPLYSKTIVASVPKDEVILTLADFGIENEEFVFADNIVFVDTDGFIFPRYSKGTTDNLSLCFYDYTEKSFYIDATQCDTFNMPLTAYICFYYTKTTDTV